MTVDFAPAARAELEAAAWHYERQRAGHGSRFSAAVEWTAKLIASFPQLGSPVPGVRSELEFRRPIVAGFPFVIAYRVIGEMVRIEAVAHMRRGPAYWKRLVR